MKDKIILDLCGGTGAWSKPYKDAGYDVRVITLPDYDVCKFRFDGPPNVHGILAAPPCTEFSTLKGSHPRNFDSAIRIVEACLQIVWTARIAGPLKWWCLENPVGFLRQFLGKPPLTVKYWWFGSDLNKPTDLWGYYEFPKRRYLEPPGLLRGIRGWSNWDGKACERRAITPLGFAQAFFKANP